jgi:hypothetical protein
MLVNFYEDVNWLFQVVGIAQKIALLTQILRELTGTRVIAPGKSQCLMPTMSSHGLRVLARSC